MYYLVSAELIMSFYSLSVNIEMLAFATYIADITVYSFTDSDPEPSVLSLLLNTFYLLSKTDTDPKKVKNVTIINPKNIFNTLCDNLTLLIVYIFNSTDFIIIENRKHLEYIDKW